MVIIYCEGFYSPDWVNDVSFDVHQKILAIVCGFSELNVAEMTTSV